MRKARVLARTVGLLGIVLVLASSPSAASAENGGSWAEWSGNTSHIDWRGKTYSTVDESFLGNRSVTPGDHVRREVRIRNLGATAGKLTVRIIRPEREGAADATGLGTAATLAWSVGPASGKASMAHLLENGTPLVSGLTLAKGASETFTLTFDFPYVETAGTQRAEGTVVSAFGVEFLIEGETPLTRTGLGLALGPWVPALAALIGGLLLVAGCARRRRPRSP